MPRSSERSGFDLLKEFPRIDFEIIFITAFDQYGIQAIKFSALDYLLKPIDREELKKAVEKAIDTIGAKRKNHSIDNLPEYIRSSNRDLPKIALPTLNEIMYVRVDEIIRCEASNNYTDFFLTDGGRVLVLKSYLKEDGGTLLMKDGSKIPISRQNREGVKTALSRSL